MVAQPAGVLDRMSMPIAPRHPLGPDVSIDVLEVRPLRRLAVGALVAVLQTVFEPWRSRALGWTARDGTRINSG